MTKKDAKAAKKDVRDGEGRQFVARVYVSLKPTVNDPEGNTIGGALASLGFGSIEGVRSGRYFQLQVRGKSAKEAARAVDAACSRLLANPVIETYEFELKET